MPPENEASTSPVQVKVASSPNSQDSLYKTKEKEFEKEQEYPETPLKRLASKSHVKVSPDKISTIPFNEVIIKSPKPSIQF